METQSFVPKYDYKKPYPLDFDHFPPTPNHNPMISSDPVITFTGVHGVLKLLLHLTLYCERGKFQLGVPETLGLMGLIECAVGAMEYELEYRPEDDGDQAETEHRVERGLGQTELRRARSAIERLFNELEDGRSKPDADAEQDQQSEPEDD